MKLDIGCGVRETPGYIRIDIDKNVKPDVCLDLECDKLPYEESTVDEIYCSHLIEHIYNLKHLFEECYRVLKPTGKMTIVIPHYASEEYHQDPGHVRILSARFFTYLSRNCIAQGGRYMLWGEFDFEATGCVFILTEDAKKRFKTDAEMTFASIYLTNAVRAVEMTLVPIKPARVMDSELPTTDLGVDWNGNRK